MKGKKEVEELGTSQKKRSPFRKKGLLLDAIVLD